MAFVKITISDDLRNFEARARQKLAIGKEGATLLVETTVKQQLRTVGAVASKDLLNSVMRMPAPTDVIRVGSDKSYAQYVEEGRKPGKIPRWVDFKPILRAWAGHKGLNVTDGQLYAIAQKIRGEGFPGRFPFRTAMENATPGVVRIFERALEGL